MKKLFLFIILLASCVQLTRGQDNSDDVRGKFIIGAKAGVNLSNVYDSEGNDLEADPKLGFAGGGFVAIPIGNLIGIQPEVLFSQKGFQATGTYPGNIYTYTRTTNYIDVPVLFSFKPIRVINILAGPQFSYLIKQKDSYQSATTTIEQEQDFDNRNVRKNTLCFLGGLDLNLSHFVLSGRVGWDIQNNNGDGGYSDPRYKNVWYQATVGYRFY